ncbi:fumarate hydratase [Eubacteriaceae bacterium ES2]|nr:fumarate hydratase [Eubacteriaceae bacterium ES2]
MRIIHTDTIIQAVSEMCIEANIHLGSDMESAITKARDLEISENGIEILETMQKNLTVAAEKKIPICQDTGMVVIFLNIGQQVQIEGGSLSEALQKGVEKGYREGFLRKSVVSDPLIRNNTGTNTPAIIHYNITEGQDFNIKLLPKGFGSENTSALKMLKPAEGLGGVKKFILETIENGSPNACAPVVVGVGIGGTMEKAALMAKEALSRPVGSHHPADHIRSLEEYLLETANQLGIGPMGLGGANTVLGININTFPTHIAGLPVAVNMGCYVNRHVEREL